MANSFIRYPQQEGVKVFGIPFGYLSKDHIHVYVNGVEATEGFTLDVETSRVTFDTAPNSVVKIQRETPRDERPVDFQDGSLLEERDLDLDSIYHQFIAQEAFDALANSIQRTDTGEWDAQGRRVANVGDPQDPADAATQEWVKGHFSWDIIQGYVGEAEAHKNGALEAEQRTQGIREATQQDTANVIADAQAEADRSKVEADRAAEKADFALAQGDRATNEADRSEAQANRGAEILKVIEQGGSVGGELMTDPAILTPDDWAFSSAKVEVAEGKLWFREAETEADTATVTTIPVENGQFYFIRINNVSITGGELELIQHDTRTYRLKAGNNMFIFRAKGPKPFVIRNPDPSDPVTAFIDYMSVRPIEQDFMQGVNASLDRATDAHAVDPTNDWHLMTPATTRTAVDAALGVEAAAGGQFLAKSTEGSLMWGDPSSPVQMEEVLFTEPGVHEWEVPEGVHLIRVGAIGGGGGAGGYNKHNGGAGGTSSFGTILSATGGQGGKGSDNNIGKGGGAGVSKGALFPILAPAGGTSSNPQYGGRGGGMPNFYYPSIGGSAGYRQAGGKGQGFGSGGGSGSGKYVSNNQTGGGGGHGGIGLCYLSVTPGTSYTITVGKGGAGGPRQHNSANGSGSNGLVFIHIFK